MELLSEPAVVTCVADAGPRERLLTFFTRGQGGVRLYARRPLPRARTKVFVEPLQGGELVWSRREGGARGRLVAFVPQRVWPGVREDLGRTLHALAFFELLGICMAEEQAQPEVFAVLVEFLNRLEAETRPGLARAAATLRLLSVAGFAPRLLSCAACGTLVDPGAGVPFSPAAGGVLCGACRQRGREGGVPASPAALGFMVRSLTLPPGRGRRLRVAAPVEREVLRLLDAFVEARAGVRPVAGAAIERVVGA